MVSKNPKIVACNRMPIQRLFRFLNSLLVVIILKPMDVSAREKLRPELHSCSQVIEEIVNTISENPTHSVVGIMKQRMKGKTLISLEFKNSLAERFGEKITKELVTNYSITDLTHLSNSYDILVRLKKLNLISQLEVGKFDLNTFESFKTNFSEHVHFRLFSEEKGIVIKRLENRCYDLVGGKTSSSELLNLVRKNLNNSLLYVKQNPVLLVFIVIFALILQEYLLTKGKKKIFFNNGNKLLDNLYQFISDLSVDSGKYFPNRSQSRELEKKVASKKENLKNMFKNKQLIKKDFKPKLFGISNETIRFNKNYAEYLQNQKEFEKQLKIFNFIKYLADTVNERSIIEEISENAQQNEIMEPIIPGTPSINRLLHGKNPSALKPVKKPINNILPPPSFSTENALKEDKDETK